MKTSFILALFALTFGVMLSGCSNDGVDPNAGKIPSAEMQTAETNFAKAKEIYARAGGKWEAMTPEDRSWLVDVYSKGNLREAEMTWNTALGR